MTTDSGSDFVRHERPPEAPITRAILRAWAKEVDEVVESDVLICGSGPSGLVCGMDLARAGKRVLIVEQTAHLGGGFWMGGYIMNKLSVRAPAEKLLVEVGCPVEPAGDGIFLATAPQACAKLIAAAADAGCRFLQLTRAVDVIVRGRGRVEGLVLVIGPIDDLPHEQAHVDPVCFEARAVVDATGHDAHVVERLAARGFCERPPGNAQMWIERSEDLVMDGTGEAFPGLFVCGLAVAAVRGTPRMGPTFGSMLLSGRKCARLVRRGDTPLVPLGQEALGRR